MIKHWTIDNDLQSHQVLIPCYLCLNIFAISWQIPKSLPHKKKEEGKTDGETVEDKKVKSSADGRVPKKLEVEIKVDGKEEEDDEHYSPTPVSWDQARRSVKQ